MTNKQLVAALAASAFTLISAVNLVAQQAGVDPRPANAPKQTPAFPGQTRAPERRLNVAFDIVPVVEGLRNPWGIAFLPGGKMLVTERVGFLRFVGADGIIAPQPVGGLPAVDNRGQGGLLDVVLDPGFATNGLIYWSYAEPRENGMNNTAVARGTLRRRPARTRGKRRGDLSPDTLAAIARRISAAAWSSAATARSSSPTANGRSPKGGCRRSGWTACWARSPGSIPTGRFPTDNPFVGKDGARPEICSIGHRNVQAAALNPTTGELWEVEHGTRGGDEINIVRKGKDYGWPTIAYGIEYRGEPITGDITPQTGMEQPLYYWDPVIGPSGMVFYTGDLFPAWKGSLFIGGHQTNDLVRLSLDGEKVTGEERLLTDLPSRVRLRDVRQGPDGALYLLVDEAVTGRMLKLVPKRPTTSGQ